MRKNILTAALVALSVVFAAGCGKSECKKYIARFCADEKSPACLQAKEQTKDWSADKCRIEGNEIDIDSQSKQLENELK